MQQWIWFHETRNSTQWQIDFSSMKIEVDILEPEIQYMFDVENRVAR